MSKCQAAVSRGSSRIRGIGHVSHCQREGKYLVAGQWYCGQHHPDRVKAREDKKREEWLRTLRG